MHHEHTIRNNVRSCSLAKELCESLEVAKGKADLAERKAAPVPAAVWEVRWRKRTTVSSRSLLPSFPYLHATLVEAWCLDIHASLSSRGPGRKSGASLIHA